MSRVPDIAPAAAAQAAPEYRVRANAFVGERTYRLTGDALTWEEAGKPLDGVFYDGIAEVRLAYRPGRATTNRYVAMIVFREGGMVEITNLDWLGPARFGDRSAEYAPFIRALCARLAERGVDVAFRKGTSAGAYVGNLLLTFFILAMIVVIAVLFWTLGATWLLVVKFGIVLWFVPTLFRYLRNAQPATFDPRAIPPGALPDAPASG